jgi:replicative DNA helicase
MQQPTTQKQLRQLNRETNHLSKISLGKIPPQVVEIESAVLGACMLLPVFSDVAELLDENCFYKEGHSIIFRAMSELTAGSQPIDILTVVEKLKQSGKIEVVGGDYYITSLTNNVVNSTNTISHCRLILQAYIKRELIRIALDIINEGYENMSDAVELLEKNEELVLKVRQRTDLRTYKTMVTILVDTFKHLENIRHRENYLTGVTSGFPELDKVTCGWQGTDLIILAARPSVGKTAFALNLAMNAAKDSAVGFFSLEMSERQLAHRALSSESGIMLWSLRNGKMNDADMKSLYEKGIQPLANHKVFIDDTANIKLSELKAKARRMVLKDHCKIIFIDYLQLITTSQQFSRKDLEVGHISSQLKGLAKDLNIPIICLSQLSRDVEKRGAVGEPKLSDLRESGAIEQDADMVMFLWKPSEGEVMENPELVQYCNVKIEKHRNGTLERFLGKFSKEIQRWEYLKVLDGSGMPMGESWKPLKNWTD